MGAKKIGKQSIVFANPPSIIESACIVGPKEGEGPLNQFYDQIISDDLYGEESWEKAESKLMLESSKLALAKAKVTKEEVDYFFGGDLLNQLMSTSFAVRELEIPFFGLYGACSTMSESLSLGAMVLDGGYANYVLASASSHFSSAERQFRFPLEQGNQRPITASWTVTGAGAVLLGYQQEGPYITHITTGKVVDYGIIDANNMGAAMAPAAADTIVTHFNDTGFRPKDYDLIITGDLGYFGRDLARDLMEKEGFQLEENFTDCGIEIFDRDKQDTHAGGSGCGCSAAVFCGYLMQQLRLKQFNRILLVATGALFSPTSAQQGESIPSVAHAVSITTQK